MIYVESGIEFDFGVASVYQSGEVEFGYGLSNTDFIVRHGGDIYLVEAKATVSDVDSFLSDDKINELVAKARDTYTFLHLAECIRPPIGYYLIVVDFKGPHSIDKALLMRRHESIKSKLKGERGHAWKCEYVRKALLVLPSELSAVLPNTGFAARCT